MNPATKPEQRRLRLSALAATLMFALVLAGTNALNADARAQSSLPSDTLTVVAVDVTDDDQVSALLEAGLDVVDVTDGSAEIFLHGPDDAADLENAGFDWVVVDHDGSAQAAEIAEIRDQEEQLALELEASPQLASPLPTGRVSYRTLDEIEPELREMAATYPDRVKLFSLPHKSLLGSTVWGVEISRDVHVESGKPVFLNTGLHHSREWPTVDTTLEFAWDVLQNDGVDPRITSLMDNAKMIVVPVVNPDGFHMSRSRIQEQKRKNCRVVDGEIPTFEQCADPANFSRGVDLNRNYGAFWGGPGSSRSVTSSNYGGQDPYSEPVIQNMVDLTAAHQVMVAFHNHAPDGVLIRTPASPLEPHPTADEAAYQGLAEHIGDALDVEAGPWTEIYYFASGVAEQHAYYTAGIFGFTTEMTPGHGGLNRFHPPFEYVIDQYFGTGFYEGSNLREAWLRAWEAAADPTLHSVLTGTARPGIELQIRKNVTVDSSPVSRPGLGTVVVPSELQIETTMTVPRDGQFEWHVLPSMRPSQYHSLHLVEQWTVSCVNPAGKVHHEVDITVSRGESIELDMSPCPGRPPANSGTPN